MAHRQRYFVVTARMAGNIGPRKKIALSTAQGFGEA